MTEKIDLSAATQFGVRWWSAACNNQTGLDLIDGPLAAAQLAFARDKAEHDQIQMHGSRGFCAHEVVILDDDGEPVAVVADEDGWHDVLADVSSTGATSNSNGDWAELPVVSEGDIPLGESPGTLDRSELNELNGSVWNGNNHVVFTASRSEPFCSEADEETDGNVIWAFETTDGYRGLTDVVIDEDWSQIDYYATNGYGNESGALSIEENGRRLADMLRRCGIGAEFSEINDGASNEQAYAAILICESDWGDAAKRLCELATEYPDLLEMIGSGKPVSA